MSGAFYAPSAQTEGGGLYEGPATVVAVEALVYDFPKKDGTPSVAGDDRAVCMKLTMKGLDPEFVKATKVEEIVEHYSFGNLKDGWAVKDGVIVNNQGKTLWARANAGVFFTELVSAGYPEDRFTGDIAKDLIGLAGELLRKPQPKSKNAKPDTKERRVTVFKAVTKLPWEKGSVAAPAAAGASASDESPEETAIAFIQELVATKGTVTKKSLPIEALRKCKEAGWSAELKQAVLPLLKDDEFLAAIDGVDLKDGQLSAAA